MDDGGAVERSGRSRSGLALLGLLGFVLSALLILAAARGDLWFDEVLSLAFARDAVSPRGILQFRNDNNHVLNTAYLYALGPHLKQIYLYRSLSVCCGIASLALLIWIAGRKGAVDGLLALLFAGSSFPLILYFSEARGYAPAIFCSLLGFAILQRSWSRLTALQVVSFWFALMLGILSHLTFAIVAFALFMAALVRELRAGASWLRRLGRLAVLFIVPFLFSAAFYVHFVGNLKIVGGPIVPYWNVFGSAAAMLLGLPDGGTFRTAGVVCYVAVVAVSFLVLRAHLEEWGFYLAALLVGPVTLIVVTRPEYLYFRYFVVAFPFFYILLAHLFATAYRARITGLRVVLVALTALLLVGQGRRIVPLLTIGRGNDRAALLYVSGQSTTGELRIGCDNETKMLLSFYSRFLPGNQTFRSIEPSRWPAEKPEWIVTRNQDRAYQPPPEFVIQNVGRYRLVREFPYGGVSGWNSFLWQHESESGAVPDPTVSHRAA